MENHYNDSKQTIISSEDNIKNLSPQKQGKYVYRFCIGFMETLLNTVLFFMVWYQFVEDHNQTGHLLGFGNLGMSAGIYFVLVFILYKYLGGYRYGIERRMNTIASEVLGLMIVNVIETFVSCAITGQYTFWPTFFCRYFFLWLLQSCITGAITFIVITVYRKVFPPLQIIEIYGQYRNHLYEKVNGRPDKYKVVKLMKHTEPENVIKKEINKYDAVLINDIPSDSENKLLKICFELDKRVYFTPKISDIIVKTSDDLNLFDTPLYLCRNMGMAVWQKGTKRFFDLLFSGLALVILSPVFCITALAIKLDDRGPIFFRQERVTEGGRRFMILKFRSMIVDAEKDGRPHPAGEKDSRITKVGNFIRATRIDELPQLINILKGDMSIVGPRPERWEHVEQYTKDIPEFTFRHKVKGGLTGYAQVYGKYNTTALDKLKLDLMYIENYSLLLDCQIVLETVRVLFQKEATEGFDKKAYEHLHGVMIEGIEDVATTDVLKEKDIHLEHGDETNIADGG